MKILKCLSLGGGVQSSVMLLMSCRGVLPRPDWALFCDARAEKMATYEYMEFLKAECQKADIELITIDSGDIAGDCVRGVNVETKNKVNPAYFVKNQAGKKGRLTKQCSREYKYRPIMRKLRELCGIPGVRGPWPGNVKVEMWLGFSTDEKNRCQPSISKFLINRWPLIEELEFSRHDCIEWLTANNCPVPIHSNCYFCPEQSDKEWLEMKVKFPGDFEKACEFDAQIRGGELGEYYLHSSLMPLADVDLKLAPQFDFMECELCGL